MKRFLEMKKFLGTTFLLLTFLLVSPVSPVGTGYSEAASVQTVKVNEVLQAGTYIPATLLNPINSDNLNADIVAIVRSDVYDSVTGTNRLIPKGTRLIGRMEGLQGRDVNVAFYRMIFPNGHSVKLPDFNGVSGIGSSGLGQKYTRHTWIKMRSAFVGAIASAGIMGASGNFSKSRYDDRSVGDEAVAGAVAGLLNTISNQASQGNNINPTATVQEGFQFNIVLISDVKIRPYR